MSSSSNKTNRNSKEDSDILSKAVILEDNDNKLSIINKIQVCKKHLFNNKIKSVPKSIWMHVMQKLNKMQLPI